VPEGHTIHALAARLERAFRGRVVAASSPQGRFAADAARLDGLELDRARAYGKHLFVDVGPETLHVHLGLIGTFPVRPVVADRPPDPSPTVRLRLATHAHVADLRGPMICTLVDAARQREIVATLGPDPLRPRQQPGRAWDRIRKSRKGIGDLLMDQSVISGVGNVYRCEVLHRQRVDPLTQGHDVSADAWRAVWDDLVLLMPLGAVFSQILTMPDQVDAARRLRRSGRARRITESLTGERLGDHFERRFLVYQRTGQQCPRCGEAVREATVAGRTLYWCPACQTRR
jgi:endonuclease-8